MRSVQINKKTDATAVSLEKLSVLGITKAIAKERMGLEGDIDYDISDIVLKADAKPKGYESGLIYATFENDGTTFKRYEAVDGTGPAVQKFAERVNTIIAAFVGVKTTQAITQIATDINKKLLSGESEGRTVSDQKDGLKRILNDSIVINAGVQEMDSFIDDFAATIDHVMETTGAKQLNSRMLNNAISNSGAEKFVSYLNLREKQAKKFLDFIENPDKGHEIGTGEGKTDYLIHLNAIAGLINGKKKSVVILSDLGKLREAYGDKNKIYNERSAELYEKLLGKNSVTIIDSNTTQNKELAEKVADSPVVFTQTSVLGFLTDSKRTKGSTEEELFNLLTSNSQIVQDEIHTIHGQSFIRGTGNDRPLTKNQIQATELVGKFVKQNATLLKKIANDLGKEITVTKQGHIE
ncbi:MAG: hypothetical protein KAQ85_10270, partial [Thermodesulfovibrionia bacterium]|nr:hypothetical protein [Thermodesulfovibrionia bacterium]